MTQNIKNNSNLNFIKINLVRLLNLKPYKLYIIGIIVIITLLIAIKIILIINELYLKNLFLLLNSIYLKQELLFYNIYHNTLFLIELISLKLFTLKNESIKLIIKLISSYYIKIILYIICLSVIICLIFYIHILRKLK